jgi:hypothetical protein
MMIFPRLAYRSRQFWNALLRPELHVTSEAILPYLSPAQLILFRQLQPSEQVHAYQVFKHLEKAGEKDADLLVAALLHDVGKVLSPLSIFDRVIIVIGRRLFPKAAKRWGEGTASGLRRPFVVAAYHAEWGGELVEQAGATEAVIKLIRHHHDPLNPKPVTRRERLLAVLQTADDGN